MSQPLRVLLVEDVEDDALLVLRALQTGGYQPEHRRVETAQAMTAALQDGPWDLIISDYAMPKFSGLNALALHKSHQLDSPFIFVSGTFGEEEAVNCLHAGATDYLLKHRLARLPSAVKRALAVQEERRRLRQAEAQLEASELRNRAILDSSMDAIITMDGSGLIVEFNHAAEKMFGSPRDEVVGQALAFQLIAAPSHERLKLELARYLNPGQNPRKGHLMEMAALRRNGQEFPIEFCLQQTALTELTLFTAFIRDISDRKQTEQALEMMRFSVDRADDSIFWLSREGRVLYANDSACAKRGYPLEEILAMSISDLDPSFEHSRWLAHFEELKCRGSITLETRHQTKAGQQFPVEMNANYVHIGGQEFDFCFLRDITLRKQNEEEIQRLAAFPQMNPNPVLELTAEGTIQFANAAAKALAGVLGCADCSEMLPPGTAEIVRECLATRKSRIRLELTYGKSIISWSFYPICDHRVVHCYAGDMTESRQLAEQLRQVQKMESVGQLAAGIAHDFNNLLTVIQGYSDLLCSELADQPKSIESVQEIAAAGERAASLTRQLLLFSRKSHTERRLVDLGELTGNLTKMLARILGEDITLQLDFQPELPPLFADPGMLEQVITNLAVNARDAMPEGGQLEIATSLVELDVASLHSNPLARPGRFICLSVRDSGCGIPEENLPKIFEPFFTTKEIGKGTGLGLATVYGIVMQHQGVLTINSQLGAGTQFKIFLPIADAGAKKLVPEGKAPAAHPPNGPSAGAETILLVEDEGPLRSLLERLLLRGGYTVLTANSGAHAQRIWPEHRDKTALLVTDLMMPGGVCGKRLAANLKREKPDLRVLFMSGYSPEIRGVAQNVEEGLHYLQKPFSNSALLEAIRRNLNSPADDLNQWLDSLNTP